MYSPSPSPHHSNPLLTPAPTSHRPHVPSKPILEEKTPLLNTQIRSRALNNLPRPRRPRSLHHRPNFLPPLTGDPPRRELRRDKRPLPQKHHPPPPPPPQPLEIPSPPLRRLRRPNLPLLSPSRSAQIPRPSRKRAETTSRLRQQEGEDEGGSAGDGHDPRA